MIDYRQAARAQAARALSQTTAAPPNGAARGTAAGVIAVLAFVGVGMLASKKMPKLGWARG